MPHGLPHWELRCGGLLSMEMPTDAVDTRPTARSTRTWFCDQSSGPFARRRDGTKPARPWQYRVERVPGGGVLGSQGNGPRRGSAGSK
jgi:hypothetical protein